MIKINRNLYIPERELKFTASRSSGPGGQHVNKVSTRVTLHFDVLNSPSLSPYQKRRILKRLDNRINRWGVLKVSSQRARSQAVNREEAVKRFAGLLEEALRRSAPRKKTRIPARAKERRLEEKKRRGRLKRERSKKPPAEE